MIPFWLLAGTAVFLAASGGIFAGSLHVAGMALGAACFLIAPRTSGRAPPMMIAGCLVLLYISATIVPLPEPLERLTGNARAAQNLRAREAICEAAALKMTDRSDAAFSLTRNRAGTCRTVLLLACAFCALVLGSSVPAEKKEQYLKFLVVFASAMAVAGFVGQWVLPQGKKIWWLFPVPHGRPIGCFVNRNHFGGFIAMFCPVAAVFLGRSLENRRPLSLIAWALSLFCLGGVVLASLSRGAVIACAVGLIVVAVSAFRLRKPLVSLGAVACFAVILAAARAAPQEEISERLNTLRDIHGIESVQTRLSTWRDCLRMWGDYPVAGIGAEATRMVLPLYRTLATRKSFSHAENEYVQIAAECGLIGVALALFFAAAAGRQWAANARAGGAGWEVFLGVGGALAVAAAHAAFDFAARVPVYAVVLSSMAGLTMPPQAISGLKRLGPRASWSVLLALVAVSGIHVLAIRRMDSSDFIANAGAQDLCRALIWSPTSWQVWYHLGRQGCILGGQDGNRFGEQCMVQAATYDAKNYRLWEELGRLRMALGDKKGASDAFNKAKNLRPWLNVPDG